MNNLAKVSRNTDNGFMEQWEQMKTKIKEYATQGKNECTMVYGKYNEQLIEKLKENGFTVDLSYRLHPNVCYGMTNSCTYYVQW